LEPGDAGKLPAVDDPVEDRELAAELAVLAERQIVKEADDGAVGTLLR